MIVVLGCLVFQSVLYSNETYRDNYLKNNSQCFIENRGQWPAEVQYLVQTAAGMNAWITNSGVVYDFYQIDPDNAGNQSYPAESELQVRGHVIKMELQNHSQNLTFTPKDPVGGYCNYFIGNEPESWMSKVKMYREIEITGIYPGIDIRYYFDDRQVRYDYRIQPGADVANIQWQLLGQYDLATNSDGELLFQTSLGEVVHGKLFAYQEKKTGKQEVTCSFALLPEGTVAIRTGIYDPQQELIIDPLIYSTFIGGSGTGIGGSGDDQGEAITVDESGNVYITGTTYSTDYPTTVGAYKTSLQGGEDVFITKLKADGSALVYSTFLGGSSTDNGAAIALNSQGNVYISGTTFSTNFPTTTGAYQTTVRGNGDAFITQLNSDGTALVYSTFLGGTYGKETGKAIALDLSGNAFVTGITTSSNFPTTTGAYQGTFGGAYDIFVTKLNATASATLFSTFIGKSGYDEAYAIVVDSLGYTYITGNTSSSNYPVSITALQKTFGGKTDGFITKLNPTGSALSYSTYLGGSENEYGNAIAIRKDYAYVTGVTYSTNYPVTSNVFQSNFGGGSEDIFISKINTTGSALEYSTYVGGDGEDIGYGIAVDALNRAYVTGGTSSSNFPTTTGAFQNTPPSSGDAFLIELNPIATGLVYSTTIGGFYQETGNAIAIDGNHNVYITGETKSSDFPTTTGAYQTTLQSGTDGFVSKFNVVPEPLIVDFNADQTGGIAPLTVQFTDRTLGGADSWEWNFGDGSTSIIQNPKHIYTTAGSYNVSLTASNELGAVTAVKNNFILVMDYAPGRVFYVRSDGQDSNNGLSWATAFASLQVALNFAMTDNEIHVAAGTYKPTSVYNLTQSERYRHFRLKKGVKIYGGFPVQGGSMEQRDPQNFGSILSGELGSEDDDYDNCYHVFYHPEGLNLDSTAVLDGFTIRKGAAYDETLAQYGSGGGMYNQSSSPKIINCTFTANRAAYNGYGGAICNNYSNPLISDCQFVDNRSGLAGAIGNDNNSNAIITNCTFKNNKSGKGGAMVNRSGSATTISNCLFEQNDATDGGAIYNYQTGTGAVIDQCNFTSNTASHGGAIYSWYESSPTVKNSYFIGNKASFDGGAINNNDKCNPLIINCIFSGNLTDPGYGDVYGGGVYNVLSSNPTLTNCTFSGNKAGTTANGYGGALSNKYTSKPILNNCIFWSNNSTKEGKQIWNYSDCSVTMNYSCYSNGTNDIVTGGGFTKNNCITTDPKFLDSKSAELAPTTTGDYLILGTSPCVDAGYNSYVPAGITTDIRGKTRIINGGSGLARVDMGAFEYQPGQDPLYPVPNLPVLISPANTTTGIVLPVTLRWHSSVNAESYHLQIANEVTFNTLIVNSDQITDTSTTIQLLSTGVIYYWRVSAKNTGGVSDWSTVWNFKTLGTPTTVTLINPQHQSVNRPIDVTFRWSKAQDRTKSVMVYGFELVSDTSSMSDLLRDTTLVDTFKVVPSLKNYTNYFWRVKSKNEAGWGGFANWSTFKTIIAKPENSLLATPLSNNVGNTQPVVLKWHIASRAEIYRVQVGLDSLFVNKVYEDSSLTDTAKTLPWLTNLTKYYWCVCAKNIGGVSDWSAVWNFKTLGTPTTVTLINPQHQSVNQPIDITFRWSKAQDRTKSVMVYGFELVSDTTSMSDLIRDTTLVDTFKVVTGLKNFTEYFWRVKSKNETGWGDLTHWSTFKTIIAKPEIPILCSPLNNSIKQPTSINLVWKTTMRASDYGIQLSKDNFSQVVFDTTLMDTSINLPCLQNFTQYSWKVKAHNIGGGSDWSQTWTFTTIMSLPEVVTLIAPSDSSEITIDTVVFRWNIGTLQILNYVFELANDPDFSDIILDSVLLDTVITCNNLLKGDFWWRVKAINDAGEGPFSQSRTFSVQIASICEDISIPTKFGLDQSYPNPFNPVTTIHYALSKSARVELFVYDLNGRVVEKLVNEQKAPGYYSIQWNASRYSSGIYFYKLEAGNFVEIKKCVLVK